MNAVRASDLPVDEQMCVDVDLDESWGGPAATLQFAVEGSWEDAVVFVEPRLSHGMRWLPAPLTVIFSDGTPYHEATQSYMISDTRTRDLRRALRALPAIANATARGDFIWDRSRLEWRQQGDGGAEAALEES